MVSCIDEDTFVEPRNMMISTIRGFVTKCNVHCAIGKNVGLSLGNDRFQ